MRSVYKKGLEIRLQVFHARSVSIKLVKLMFFSSFFFIKNFFNYIFKHNEKKKRNIKILICN